MGESGNFFKKQFSFPSVSMDSDNKINKKPDGQGNGLLHFSSDKTSHISDKEKIGASIRLNRSTDGQNFHCITGGHLQEDNGGSTDFSFLESSHNWPKEMLTMGHKAMNRNLPVCSEFYVNDSTGQKIALDITLIKADSHELLLIYRRLSIGYQLEGHDIQSSAELSRFQDNIPIGLFQINQKGDLTYLNQWMLTLLGYPSKEKLGGDNFRNHFEVPTIFDDLLATVLNDGYIEDTEVRIIRSDGQLLWVIISARKISDNSNSSILIDGYFYDISARNMALDQLKTSEQMFKAISDNINNGLYLFGQEGRFLYCNPALAKITGYSEKELLGMKFYEFIHPDFQKIVKERGQKRVKGKQVPTNYEFKIITKSGEERWVEIVSNKLKLKDKDFVLGAAIDITERKQSLETIKKSEENYKSLYSFIRLMADNVPDMIWAKDLNNAYIFANRALTERLFNTSDTRLAEGKTDMHFAKEEQVKHPGNSRWFTFGENGEISDNAVMKHEKSMKFDESGYVNGKLLSVNIHKSPLYDEAGNLIGTVGSARDVSLQKELEKKQEHDAQLKNLIYRISNAVNTTKDLTEFLMVVRMELGKLIDTTNMYIALYNKEDETLTLPYFADEKDRFVRFPAHKTLTHYLMLANKPMLLHEDEIMELANRGEIDITGSLARVWLGVPLMANNETIGAIVIQNYKDPEAFTADHLEMIRFISAQVSVSITRKKADDALRESEFALRQIIDHVPVMIFAKDKEHRLVLVNQIFAAAYGKHVYEIEGLTQDQLHPVQEEIERSKIDDLAVIQNGQRIYNKEEFFTDHKGKKRILQTTKIPLVTGGEKGIVMLGVAIDISERKKEEIELKNAKEKAEGSDRLKTAFLANMSHEIRTPMNAIIGFSELLNDPDLTADGRKEFIRLINDNSRELLNLLEDIIDVAKIEADQVKVIRSTCKVNLILEELQKSHLDLLTKYTDKDIKLTFHKLIPDKDFAIISDPLRFKQIMNNLIGNAIKFTKKGNVEFGYTIEGDKQIVFYVKDTGIGLASDKLSLIFERFRQAEESSTKLYGGTGLGLTISRRLAEMLDGSMWVESELHKGSTFYFSLPLEIVNNAVKTKPLRISSEKQDWSEKTLVVAEDENSNFELLQACLFKTRINLIRAVNGKEAVKIVENHKEVDLVLMDMRMPVMDGYEATRIIKESNPELPIVSLTAYAMADDKQKILEAGCDEYMSKPFNSAKLIQVISKYIKA